MKNSQRKLDSCFISSTVCQENSELKFQRDHPIKNMEYNTTECAISYKQAINHGVVCSVTVMCSERQKTDKNQNEETEKQS